MSVEAAKRAVSQVATRLQSIFGNKIDLSDYSAEESEERTNQYNTRALAALYVKSEIPMSIGAAANCVTDGTQDGGIDAIAWSESAKTLYLVQSKWRNNPNKGIELGDFLKLKNGLQHILELDSSYFNAKSQSKFNIIKNALNDIDTKVRVILVHTSAQNLSKDITDEVKEIEKSQNQFTPGFLTFEECGLANVVNIARSEARSAKIDVEVLLKNFGVVSGPFGAFYGEISATDVYDWYEKFRESLFSENLRFVLPNSDVNQAIIETIQKVPEFFWYYNNGITAVCKEMNKKPMGGGDSASGVFDVTGLSVVNGAQTIGSIYAAKTAGLPLDNVRIHIRFIPLKNAPNDFGANVTRTNNTQNNLAPMDFVALDPNQERLFGELKNLGVQYAYRRGDTISDEAKGFDLREATVALACANTDLKLAVYAKRYISGLWEDINKDPYTTIFNAQITGRYLWALVRLSREIEKRINTEAEQKEGRERLILVHGNRFLMHLLLAQLDLAGLYKKHAKITARVHQANQLFDTYGKQLVNILMAKFTESYPGNIFKNQDKQEEIKTILLKAPIVQA